MEAISSDEIKDLQLEMLVKFASFCKKKSLNYMLCGGTLLGAIRHRDFIPWDNDIDLMMPRPDYEKLVAMAKNGESVSDIIDVLEYRLENTAYPFVKLSDSRTIVEEKYTKSESGVWIDVFPIDGNFRNNVLNYLHYKTVRILRKLVECQYYDIGIEKKRIIQIIRLVITPVLNIIPHKLLCDCLSYVSRLKDFDSSKFVGRVLMGYGTRQRTEREKLLKLVQVEFVGYQFNAPSNYDELLTQIYGQYMELPPEEQRISHDIEAYWKKDII